MHSSRRPDAIDARVVLRVYAAVAIIGGTLVYMWPLLVANEVELFSLSYLRVVAAAVTAFGCCAEGFAAIDDPVARQRGLLSFATAHLVFGGLFFLQWFTVLTLTGIPPAAGWTPLLVGVVLGYIAVTGREGTVPSWLIPEATGGAISGARPFVVRNKPSLYRLRSQYEEQIRHAARQEERARLARDLHDAVKQQLFVIQTAAATAQTRFETDDIGSRMAIDQVRSSVREAMAEMDAMLDQLQAAPLENAGLLASLKKHAEALGFRTGARVDVEVGTLPPDNALAPGAREAIFRVGQEALSNIARHARAAKVRVGLEMMDDQVVLVVQDDGQGFRSEATPRGMGMANMAARAAEIGAQLEVTSSPNTGTCVRLAVPCRSPSLRPDASRAVGWMIVLIASVAYLAVRGASQHSWGVALAVLAGMGVIRHVVAVCWMYRERAASAP